MAAVFHALGYCLMYVRRRGKGERFYFLGTTVTSPEVDVQRIQSPVTTDLVAPMPVNFLYHGEVHTVTAVLNALDYTTYSMVKSKGQRPVGGLQRLDDKKKLGQLTVPVDDFELMLIHTPSNGEIDTPPGRLYYSATPTVFRETTDGTRLLEATVQFNCIPLLLPKMTPIQPRPDNRPNRRFIGFSRSTDTASGAKVVGKNTAIGAVVGGVFFAVDDNQGVGILTKAAPVTAADPKEVPADTDLPADGGILWGGAGSAPFVGRGPISASPIQAGPYDLYLYTEIAAQFV